MNVAWPPKVAPRRPGESRAEYDARWRAGGGPLRARVIRRNHLRERAKKLLGGSGASSGLRRLTPSDGAWFASARARLAEIREQRALEQYAELTGDLGVLRR